MQRAKEFKGLKVPPKGFVCDGNNDCVNSHCYECLFYKTNFEPHVKWYLEHDLTKITQPFGLLSGETQERLKVVSNGEYGKKSNIQYYAPNNTWINYNPFWNETITYRLDPNWKPEPVKKITKEELWKIAEEKIGKFEVSE